MLDMAPQLSEFSRLGISVIFYLILLGCQVIVTEQLEGMTISFPSITRNFYVDGHKPSHH